MPTSSWDGRSWVTDRLADSTVSTVVDVGPGRGTYSILGRHLIWTAQWWGLEIFEPYVGRFLLGELYDQIIVGDMRDWRPEGLTNYGILFGDVLEHASKDDAVETLNWHLDRASEVYVSVPIVHSPQEACYGNPFEAHVHHWTHDEVMEVMPEGTEAFIGVQVGRYFWRRED